MRRVMKFENCGKTECERLNEWLARHPDVTLVDIKPVLYGSCTIKIYAILEIPEKKNEE